VYKFINGQKRWEAKNYLKKCYMYYTLFLRQHKEPKIVPETACHFSRKSKQISGGSRGVLGLKSPPPFSSETFVENIRRVKPSF
jgi:hypothetical protein